MTPADLLGVSVAWKSSLLELLKGKGLKIWVIIHPLWQSWECLPGVAGVVGLCSDDLKKLRGFLGKRVQGSHAVL